MSFSLGQNIGPMPAGAWAAAVAGGLGLLWYSRTHSSAASGTAVPATVDPTQSLVGTGGSGAMGSGGYFYPTDGSGTQVAPGSAAVTTNAQWGSQAFAWLAAQGMAPDVVDKAIRDYLSGISLSAQENALVSQALGKYGQPPEGLPDAPALPVVTPAPAPAPAPPPPAPAYSPPPPPPPPAPAPPSVRTYVVRPGDSLSRIAARYPEPWITWQSLYNANRAVIGGNPNLIHPGQTLVIA